MILFANFLIGIGKVAHYILQLYIFILFFRVILSWIQVPSLNQIHHILYLLTEPVLRPIRKYVPPYKFGGLDISPILVFMLIMFVDSFLIRSILDYAISLKFSPRPF